MKRIAIFSMLLFLLLPSLVFAQRNTGGRRATTHDLTVTANVNAQVVIESIETKEIFRGNTSFTQTLPPGTYRISVEADGYIGQSRDVNLSGNTSENFSLQPATGRVEIIMGGQFLNMKVTDPRSMIDIYDNGSLVEGNGFILNLRPGQHTIQIVSGGLMAQATIQVQAGRTYILEPFFELRPR